jgi:predicted secreted hydrolase
MKRGLAHNILNKRFSHLNNSVLDFLEKEEVKVYEKISKHSKTKLNSIRKKVLDYPRAIYPGKNIPLEWWYFTGHLQNKTKKYGYEFCIFKFHPQALRVGIIPLSFLRKKPFLALHFALTDKTNKKFKVFQDSGLIHHQDFKYDDIDLKLNNCSLQLKNDKFKIRTKSDFAELELNLDPLKKIIKHFDKGYTVMYSPPQHRTYYLAFTRLKSNGKLKIGKTKSNVSGLSWFDHQKLNLPKRSSLRGWDWFSIMLNDKTELMFFVLRNKQGVTNKFMGGSYIDKNSKKINLSPTDILIEQISSWTSKKTKVTYPSGWNIEVPRLKISLNISPVVKNQEITRMFTTPMNYWEGACDVKGTKRNKKVKGQSYVELVGYDQKFFTKVLESFYR